MLPNRKIREFFDVCGFNTQSTSLSNHQNVAHHIRCVHVSTALALTICEFLFFYRFHHFTELIEIVNEFIEYSGSICTYWLIIFDSANQCQAHQRFWAIVRQLTPTFSQPIVPRSYFVKIIELFFGKIFFDLIWVIYYGFGGFEGLAALMFYTAYTIPIVICRIRLFYYIFCLEIVLYEIKAMQQEIKCMRRRMDSGNTCWKHTSNSFQPQRIKWMHKKYYDVHDMITLLNQIFGWSQVSAVLFCFFAFFTDLNYLYIHFRELSTAKNIREQLNNS